jgi:dTMP kinase
MFITFEGGEGTGKTTLIQRVFDVLKHECDVIMTREPGGSPIAEVIRDIVLNPNYKGITPKTEALLIAASRTQHLDDKILPALEAGKTVLCDRYLDSSLAYQACARNLGFEFVLAINAYAAEHLPDITFYIDLEPEVGISRISNREKYDRLDQETLAYHRLVRKGYLEVVKRYPDRIIVIDGLKSIDAITMDVIAAIRRYQNI